MAEGGSNRNLDILTDIQKTLEDTSDTLNHKSAESKRFCRETKQNISSLPDSDKKAVFNKANMIMDAAAAIRKSVESVEEQASGLKMLTHPEIGDVPNREHTGRKYLDRDSGLGLSVRRKPGCNKSG
ncbi:uncharacterized protein LOC127847928 isoform X2 [Dreissena polymorpha]|uniref:uncharacterized protein LOC127847928 isoform X2 n=1 Tax=Dreissena polymorpha TaxID=45954 RepID=UPI0022656828|nr:uncharacterized protein LOC127847928 isoform X2 [Dreissena polymorpha]